MSFEVLKHLLISIAGQFAIYGDLKKALGATGGVEISK
jgi:hypothetical protein